MFILEVTRGAEHENNILVLSEYIVHMRAQARKDVSTRAYVVLGGMGK